MTAFILGFRQRHLPLLALLAVPSLFAQPAKPLSEIISSSETTIKNGSTVRIDITMANQSSDIMILRSNRLGPQEAGMIVWDQNGHALSPRDGFKERPDTIHRGMGVVIRPGKSVTESVDLNKWFDLTTPGQYTVQSSRKVPGDGEMVESNKLTITITP